MNNLTERLADIQARGFVGATELMADLKRGVIRYEDILLAQEQKMRPEVQKMMQTFQAGKLFHVQVQSFDQFMAGDNWQEDYQTWLDAKANFSIARLKMDFQLALFALQRIVDPNPWGRKRIKDAPGNDLSKYRESWVHANMRHNWHHWRADD